MNLVFDNQLQLLAIQYRMTCWLSNNILWFLITIDSGGETAFHGGTIMALMERYVEPHKPYFEWSVKPGEGYRLDFTC